MAREVGFPVMLKASWGGGGRGMRIVENESELPEMVATARREAKAAFGNDEVYLEKLVRRARHIEVQLLGDTHGNLVHLFERDCTVQRRNQKVIERAPATFFTAEQRQSLCEEALKIGRAVNYLNAGTVEFLQDADSGKFYFIEVNPRVQVEHTVTEAVTGIDIVRAQIRIAEGARIGDADSGVPKQEDIRLNGYAMQCRVTTEDPENNFIPDYGRITAYRSPAGFGMRLDAGTAYSGAIITRSYDSLLVKVTAWSPTPAETIARMHRALWEFRVRGVVTNLRFLDQVIMHPQFATAEYTTKFIDQTPELFRFPRKTRSRHAPAEFHRRRGRQRQSGSEVAAAPAATGRSRSCRSSICRRPRPAPSRSSMSWVRRSSRNGCSSRSGCCSPTRRCAMRISRCWRRAFAPMTCRRSRRTTRACCRICSRWNAGAARRSTWRCAFSNECPWERLQVLRERDAESAAADAAALGERGRLHQLSRQCRALLRQAGGAVGHRPVPRLRLAQLGREHARRDRCRARVRQAVRGGDLLHRQSVRSEADQVRPQVLPVAWRAS